jgi:hypothetical protein
MTASNQSKKQSKHQEGKMQGIRYRIATAIKETGEQWNIPSLVRLGLRLRDRAVSGGQSKTEKPGHVPENRY